jgi:hypothetical protein
MKVTSCCRPRLPRTAVKALHWRSFFTLHRTEQPARTVHQGLELSTNAFSSRSRDEPLFV